MANATGSFGLRPARQTAGSSMWAVEKCYVSANYATEVFIGDPVLLDPLLANKDATGQSKCQ